MILSIFLDRKKLHKRSSRDALQINEKLSDEALASLKRLYFDPILKVLYMVTLSGKDRAPSWMFRDQWDITNVSICLSKKNLTILSNF